jgi:hypothetical protein
MPMRLDLRDPAYYLFLLFVVVDSVHAALAASGEPSIGASQKSAVNGRRIGSTGHAQNCIVVLRHSVTP